MNAESMFLENLNDKDWWQPNATRQSAEDKLRMQDIGAFIIRPSSKKDCFALSYKARDGGISHSLVEKTAVGYKLPEETTVYPTLSALLRTCKFLKWNEAVDDQALAILIDAFPDTKHEDLISALKRSRNDVNGAIDILLRLAAQAPSSSSTSQPQASPQPHSTRHVPVPNFRNDEFDLVTTLSRTTLSSSIAQLFTHLASNQVDASIIQDHWETLERPLFNQRQIPQSLESNLDKILHNTTHPMGKKVDLFILAFNTTYGGVAPTEIPTTYSQAVNEVQAFLVTMEESIVSKVGEFNSPVGSMVVWKVLQNILFRGIYSTLLRLFELKNSAADQTAQSHMSTLQPMSLAQYRIPEKFHLKGTATPYAPAILTLASLSRYQNVFDKLECLVDACLTISTCVSQYYATNTPPPEPLNVTADDLLQLFTYALSHSQVPTGHVVSEFNFVKEFLHRGFKTSLEGFALVTLEAAINNLERAATSPRQPPPPSSQPLAPTPAGQPVHSPSQPHRPFTYLGPHSGLPSGPGQSPQPQLQPQAQPQPHPQQQVWQAHPPGQPQQVDLDNFFAAPMSPQPFAGYTPPPPAGEDPFAPNHRSATTPTPAPAPAPVSPTPTPAPAPVSPTHHNPAFETLKRAESSYIESLKQLADSPDAHNQLAAYYNSKGQVDKALHHCNQALLLDPHNEIARQNMISLTRASPRPPSLG